MRLRCTRKCDVTVTSPDALPRPAKLSWTLARFKFQIGEKFLLLELHPQPELPHDHRQP